MGDKIGADTQQQGLSLLSPQLVQITAYDLF